MIKYDYRPIICFNCGEDTLIYAGRLDSAEPAGEHCRECGEDLGI